MNGIWVLFDWKWSYFVVSKFIEQNQLPHLLFYGPPGTGKTTSILACARKLYSEKQFHSMVLELNASDDRGIGIVRGRILDFASTKTIFSKGFKLIILDEADAMTNDAQNALRRGKTPNSTGFCTFWMDFWLNCNLFLCFLVLVIEKYTDNVRFCIICNYLSKIIPALQSRCTRFRFAPLAEEQILPRLEYVVDQERFVWLTFWHFWMDWPKKFNRFFPLDRLKVSEDGKKALIKLANGDMRKVLNVLQSTWMAYKDITEETVYLCVGHPTPNDIKTIINWLMSVESFQECFESE